MSLNGYLIFACYVQIKEQSPELANQSHVMQLTLDQVYDFAVNPTEQTLPPGNVMFRFMPDAQQVKHALEVRVPTSAVGICCPF